MATETIGDLKTRLLRLLRDPSGDVYEDAFVEECLQLALDELAMQTAHAKALPFVARATVTLVADQELYAIGTSPAAQRVLRIEKVTRLDANGKEVVLVPVEFGQKFTGADAGTPLYYFLRADSVGEVKLGLLPIPDVAGTVYVYHVSMGADIVDDNTEIVFPRAFRPFILMEALAKATAFGGDGKANLMLQQQLAQAIQERDWLVVKWQQDETPEPRGLWEMSLWG